MAGDSKGEIQGMEAGRHRGFTSDGTSAHEKHLTLLRSEWVTIFKTTSGPPSSAKPLPVHLSFPRRRARAESYLAAAISSFASLPIACCAGEPSWQFQEPRSSSVPSCPCPGYTISCYAAKKADQTDILSFYWDLQSVDTVPTPHVIINYARTV